MPSDTKIERKVTLGQLECLDAALQTQKAPRTIWLASDYQSHFFVDVRVAALVANAAHLGELDVIDWGGSGDNERALGRFTLAPEGVSAAMFARRITTAPTNSWTLDQDLVLRSIGDRGGRAEPKPTGETVGVTTRTLSIYAFDECNTTRYETALALSRSDDYAAFKRQFESWRADYFEVGLGEGYWDRVGAIASDLLTRFVYEIYQNTRRHGRRSRRHEIIAPGLRYVRIKRHIGTQSQLADRASGFDELQAYILQRKATRKQNSYYEISISDSGLGIADRFLSTCRSYEKPTMDTAYRHWLINEIISESLSSSSEISGAGHGLQNALKAVSGLGGFISVRTGDTWMYYSGLDKLNFSQALKPQVSSGSLPHSRGTQICMLYPLSAV